MRKQIIVCDNCGKEIKRASEHYRIGPAALERARTALHTLRNEGSMHLHITFESDRFVDGTGHGDNNQVSIDLCGHCIVTRFIPALEKIAARA